MIDHVVWYRRCPPSNFSRIEIWAAIPPLVFDAALGQAMDEAIKVVKKRRGKAKAAEAETRAEGEFDTPALKTTIAAMVAEGALLVEICKIEGMPTRKTIYGWLDADPTFVDAMERAR